MGATSTSLAVLIAASWLPLMLPGVHGFRKSAELIAMPGFINDRTVVAAVITGLPPGSALVTELKMLSKMPWISFCTSSIVIALQPFWCRRFGSAPIQQSACQQSEHIKIRL